MLVFLLISLSVVNWFDGWNYIHQLDALFFLNPERKLYDVMYSWRDSYTLGKAGFGFSLIPFYFFQSLFLKFFSIFLDYWRALVLSQFITYYLNVFTAFLFSWLFFREIGRILIGLNIEKNGARIALILVSFFYVVNPITMSMVFGRYSTWAPFWSATPLLCYFYLRYLYTLKIKYILFSALTFITPLGAGFSQVGYLNLFLMFFLITILVYVRQRSYTIKALTLKALTFSVILALLMSWDLIPKILGLEYTTTYIKPRMPTVTAMEKLQGASRFTTIANIYRFIGYHVLHITYEDSFPFAWAEPYLNNNLVMSMLFIHPILFAFSLILYSREKDKTLKQSFLILAILFVSLPIVMKGTAEPFSEIGLYLLKVHEGFFRHPHNRFIYSFILIYSLILLFLIRRMFMLFKSKRFYAILLLIFALFSFLGYPFFTNDMVHPSDKIDLSSTDYLHLEEQLGENLSDLTNYRLLIIPYSPTTTYSYNISGKVNHVTFKSLVWAFVPNSTIIQFAFSPVDKVFINYLSRYIEANDYFTFLNLLKIMNIKYIVLHKDFSLKYEIYSYYKRISRLSIKFVSNLEKEGLITKIFENKDIAIYEVNEEPNKIVEAMLQTIIVGDSGKIFYVKPGEAVNEYIFIPKSGKYTLVIYGKGYFEVMIANHKFEFNSSDFGYKYFEPFFLSRGMHNLTIITPIKVLKEYSFRDLHEWDIKEAISKGYVLNIVREGPNGEYVLKVVTSRDNRGFSWILGEPVSVNPGGRYLIVTRMKYENVKQSHIPILGYDNITKKWSKSLQLVQVPIGQDGTSDWREYKAGIIVPENMTKIRPALNTGWVLDPSKGNATTWFGNITIYLVGEAYILNIWLYSTETNQTLNRLFEVKEKPAEIISYQKINPTLWKVRVNATRPFMLSFAAAYDPLWEARVYKNGKEVEVVKSIPLYSIINGFWINETGELEIVIKFKSQDWLETGLVISVTTFALCILYLIRDWRRDRGEAKMVFVVRECVEDVARGLSRVLRSRNILKVVKSF